MSRDPQKGYSATFSSFVEKAQVPNSVTEGGIVEVLDHECAIEKLFQIVGPIINSVASKIQPFPACFGVKSDAMSPFCKTFNSHTDLLRVYQASMPNDDDNNAKPIMTEPEETDSLSDETASCEQVNIPSLTELVSVLQGNTANEESSQATLPLS